MMCYYLNDQFHGQRVKLQTAKECWSVEVNIYDFFNIYFSVLSAKYANIHVSELDGCQYSSSRPAALHFVYLQSTHPNLIVIQAVAVYRSMWYHKDSDLGKTFRVFFFIIQAERRWERRSLCIYLGTNDTKRKPGPEDKDINYFAFGYHSTWFLETFPTVLAATSLLTYSMVQSPS